MLNPDADIVLANHKVSLVSELDGTTQILLLSMPTLNMCLLLYLLSLSHIYHCYHKYNFFDHYHYCRFSQKSGAGCVGESYSPPGFLRQMA